MRSPAHLRRPTNIPGDYPLDAVAIARLTEQILGLAHRIDHEHDLSKANFVTFEALMKSESDKVKLALDASDKAIATQNVVTDRALTKQEMATEKRFESVNEFRKQLADLIARFATLERVDLLFEQLSNSQREATKNTHDRIDRIDDTVKAIQIWQGNITGRLAVGGLVLTVVMAVVIFAANYATRS